MPDLIVREPFGGYQRGSRITDPATVKVILDGPHKRHVIVSAITTAPAQAEPKPAEQAEPKPADKSKA